jgi:Sec-independent protein secretion pathway component TatC
VDCDIIAELSEGIQFFLKFLESVKKKLLIISVVFLIAAVIAYPATDYIINDSIERSLPHNIRTPGITDEFDQLLVIFDGPFSVNDVNVTDLLNDPDKKVMLYTPLTNISEAENIVYDVITANTESESVTNIISNFILGNSNLTVSELLDAVMNGGRDVLTLDDISDTSELIVFQTIPYEKETQTTAVQKAGDEFKNITGRTPMFTIVHIEKEDKSASGKPMVVYTKPLEVPLLKLKMSLIIAVIAILPILFYMAGKEITKYVDVKKFNLSERIRIKPSRLIIVAIAVLISFVLGAAYSYFFMAPLFIQFLYISAAASGAQATYSIYDFISFIATMTLIFGLIFEFPVITFILNRIGLVQKRMLTKYRRHIYVLFFIVAAIITPPDIVSQIIVAIPMIFFYELSVIIVRLFGKRDPAMTAAVY